MPAGTNRFHFSSIVEDAGNASMFFADKEYPAVDQDAHGTAR